MALPRLLRVPQRLTLSDRRILTLMSLAGLVASYSGSILTHTIPFTRKGLGLEEGDMSWVLALIRLASLTALAFSFYGDRKGRRVPFLVALAVLPSANLLTALVPGVVAFTVFQSIAKIGVVAVSALAIVLLAEELSPGLRAYGLGVFALAGAVGAGTSLLLLPIADRSDDAWRLLFGLSAVGLITLPLLVRFLRESRAFVPTERRAPISAALRGGHARYLWPMAGVAFFVAVFSSVAFAFSLERLIDDLDWGTSQARLLLMVFTGLGTLGLLVGGRLADLVGRRPTEVLALMLGLAGGIGFYTFDSGWLLAPASFLAMFGATALTPALAAHRSELFPTGLRATAGAWINNAAIVGGIVGFGIGGLSIDTWGLGPTVTVLGGGVIIAAFMVLPLPETRGRDLMRRPASRPPQGTTAPAPDSPTEIPAPDSSNGVS